MSQERDDTGWLKHGTQRQAVAQALRKPMTTKEICLAARVQAPRLHLRDVWHLLGEMRARGLVACHNPRLVTGRLYELTTRGRAAVAAAFVINIHAPPANIDWHKYSWVVRARVRRLTLVGLIEREAKTQKGQTATAVRKHLGPENTVGFNRLLRALKDLVRLGLVRQAGMTQKGCRKLYQSTVTGRRIVEQLKR